MAKPPRPRLEDIVADSTPKAEPVAQHAWPSAPPPPPAPTPIAKPAKTRSHTSIYLSVKVRRVLDRIARDTDDKTAHDVMIEGIELVLRKYGKPSIAEIERE